MGYMRHESLDEETGLKGLVFPGAEHAPLSLIGGQEQGHGQDYSIYNLRGCPNDNGTAMRLVERGQNSAQGEEKCQKVGPKSWLQKGGKRTAYTRRNEMLTRFWCRWPNIVSDTSISSGKASWWAKWRSATNRTIS